MKRHCPLLTHIESQLSRARRPMDSSTHDDSRDGPCSQNRMQMLATRAFLKVRSMQALVLGGLAFAVPSLPFLLPSDSPLLSNSSPLYLASLSIQVGLSSSPPLLP